MPQKPLFMIDFDGVLSDTYEQIAAWHDAFRGTHYTPFDPARWPDHTMRDMWGPEADVDGPAFDQSGFAYQAEPIEGVREGVAQMAEFANLAILSSGYDWVRPLKTAWAARHLPQISAAHYLNAGESKAQICLKNGAKFIIEDRYDYALDCAEAGVPAIVLDGYQWGQGPNHPLIHHAPTWWEIPALAREILAA